jgi:hypothetical protein
LDVLSGIIRVSGLLAVALSWAACGSGGSSAVPPAAAGGSGGVGAPVTSSSVVYALAPGGSTQPLPAAGGYGGSIAFPAFDVPAGATITATSSATAPSAVLRAASLGSRSTGTINVYYSVRLTPSHTLAFPTVPAFTVLLPPGARVADQQFYYEISEPAPAGAASAFRTEGPASISGRTLTFLPSAIPLTLKAGVSYTFGFYGSATVATSTPSDLLFVTDGTAIVAFPVGAGGDAAPVRTIAGPHTGLSGATSLAHDRAGNIYAANLGANTITEYPADADGDVAPIRTIRQTGAVFALDVAVDAQGQIYVGNLLNGPTPAPIVAVYAATATGNATPIRTIATGAADEIGGLAIDAGGDLVAGVNHDFPGPGTRAIDVFASGANGTPPPVRSIVGPSTGIGFLGAVAVGPGGRIYTTSYLNSPLGAVLGFAASANGDAVPETNITGPLSRLNFVGGIAVDDNGFAYVGNAPVIGGPAEIDVFAPGTNGNVAPQRIIAGPHTALANGVGGLMILPRALAFP